MHIYLKSGNISILWKKKYRESCKREKVGILDQMDVLSVVLKNIYVISIVIKDSDIFLYYKWRPYVIYYTI